VMMLYSQVDEPIPADAVAVRDDPKTPGVLPKGDPIAGKAVHHPTFGRVLKKKMDALGIECIVHSGLGGRIAEHDAEVIAFFKRHFDAVE
jgi:hypothetical protein